MNEERDAAAVRILPPLVPLVTIFLGIGLNRIWPVDTGLDSESPVLFWAGLVVVVVALLGFGLPAVLVMRRSGQSEHPWKPTHEIVERGPFKVTRNPMYLQMVLICLGFAVMKANLWLLVLTPLCGWVLQSLAILPEEAYLELKFGEDYRSYKRRVRRWI